MRDKETFLKGDFARCVQFHGHTCPGLAIGFQAAKTLMKQLGVRKAPDEELLAIVETDACGADAIQVMTGCTFGKGNFRCGGGKMKRWVLLLCIVPIFLSSCVTGSSERKKDNCPSGVPASGSQKYIEAK